jgi:hypothetical protein
MIAALMVLGQLWGEPLATQKFSTITQGYHQYWNDMIELQAEIPRHDQIDRPELQAAMLRRDQIDRLEFQAAIPIQHGVPHVYSPAPQLPLAINIQNQTNPNSSEEENQKPPTPNILSPETPES